MSYLIGLDLSFSEPSQQWWYDRYAEGYRVMVQGLWTGWGPSSAGLIGVAERNIYRARAAGFIVCGYTNVAPWNDGDAAFNGAKATAAAEWDSLTAVFVDVEIKAWNGQSIREADIKRCLELIETAGKKTAIYSANWFWTGHLGNPTWPWLRQYKLWNADYDNDPTVNFDYPYGPWSVGDLMGKQYTGTTDVGGYQIDHDTFRKDFFEQEVEPMAGELRFVKKADSAAVYISDGLTKRGITSMTYLREYAKVWDIPETVHLISDHLFARLIDVTDNSGVDKAITDAGGKFRQWCMEAVDKFVRGDVGADQRIAREKAVLDALQLSLRQLLQKLGQITEADAKAIADELADRLRE